MGTPAADPETSASGGASSPAGPETSPSREKDRLSREKDRLRSRARRHRNVLRWCQVLATPLAVAVVGLLGAMYVAKKQAQSSLELQHEIQQAQAATALALEKNQEEASTRLQTEQIKSAERIARATQETKLLEMFTAQFMSPSANVRASAIGLLSAVNPDLGGRLAERIAKDTSQPTLIRQEALNVAKNLSGPAFVSIAESCEHAPAPSFTGEIDPKRNAVADEQCKRSPSSRPHHSDGSWSWDGGTVDGLPLTCTCHAKPVR